MQLVELEGVGREDMRYWRGDREAEKGEGEGGKGDMQCERENNV